MPAHRGVGRPNRSALLRALVLAAVLVAALLALMGSGVRPGADPMERASFRGGAGYWLLAKDGGVFAFGDATFFGPNRNQGNDIAGMAATATGEGYWTVDDDGDVFAYGDATDYGSRPGPEIDDITGFAARSAGDGYWMVSRDGAVYAFGGAKYYGSANTLKLSKAIVGMAATPSGNGYWLIAGDGGVFSYGDARFFGSTGNLRLTRPVIDFGPSPDGNGYRFIGSDGGVFSYGSARFFGSTGAMTLNQPIVGFATTASGNGYWLVAQDGGVFAFGDAQFYGSTGSIKLNSPIVAIVATPRVKVAPVARDDTATVDEDGQATIAVESNDTHLLPAAVSINSTPAHGSATVSGTTVVYTPAANYNGPDSFAYKLTDTVGHSATATVTVTVTPVNDAPTASGGSTRSTAEDTPLSGTLAAVDVDAGDTLTYSKVADPSHGTVSVNASTGAFTYTPNTTYNGPDSFTFKVNDGTADSNTATVAITVTAVNNLPTITPINDLTTNEDTATSALAFTIDDVETAAGSLTVAGSSSNTTLVPDANVVIGGSGASRTVTVTPAANQNGGPVTITVTVTDGNSGTAIETFDVTVTAVNDAPVAVSETATTPPVTLLSDSMTATDVDGDILTYDVVAGPTNGLLTWDDDGTFTYLPFALFHGTDSFTFTASDGALQSNTATFTINVNGAPVAVDDSGTTVSGTAVVTVTTNDSDPDGDSLTVTADVSVTVNNGAVVCVAGVCTYTADPSFHGTDTFTYTLADTFGATDTATVTITVP